MVAARPAPALAEAIGPIATLRACTRRRTTQPRWTVDAVSLGVAVGRGAAFRSSLSQARSDSDDWDWRAEQQRDYKKGITHTPNLPQTRHPPVVLKDLNQRFGSRRVSAHGVSLKEMLVSDPAGSTKCLGGHYGDRDLVVAIGTYWRDFGSTPARMRGNLQP